MFRNQISSGMVSRRRLLQSGAGLVGGAMLPSAFSLPAFGVGVADQPAIGTWPAGSQGDTVNVAAAVPRPGTYAVQGEDELKGWQLAVDHINSGDPLLKKIAPKVSKGLLGKKVNLLSADSAAKPNQAVQEIQTFINQNKIILMTGSTSPLLSSASRRAAAGSCSRSPAPARLPAPPEECFPPLPPWPPRDRRPTSCP